MLLPHDTVVLRRCRLSVLDGDVGLVALFLELGPDPYAIGGGYGDVGSSCCGAIGCY